MMDSKNGWRTRYFFPLLTITFGFAATVFYHWLSADYIQDLLNRRNPIVMSDIGSIWMGTSLFGVLAIAVGLIYGVFLVAYRKWLSGTVVIIVNLIAGAFCYLNFLSPLFRDLSKL